MTAREQQCRALYRQAFCEPDTAFEDRLFRYTFSNCHTLCENGAVVSMLFALPCRIVTGAEGKAARYLYAAATEKVFRGQGYMTRLMQTVQAETDGILFLRPAEEGLFAFYRRLGFSERTLSPADRGAGRILPMAGFARLAAEEKPDNGKSLCRVMVYPPDAEFFNLYFPYCME